MTIGRVLIVVALLPVGLALLFGAGFLLVVFLIAAVFVPAANLAAAATGNFTDVLPAVVWTLPYCIAAWFGWASDRGAREAGFTRAAGYTWRPAFVIAVFSALATFFCTSLWVAGMFIAWALICNIWGLAFVSIFPHSYLQGGGDPIFFTVMLVLGTPAVSSIVACAAALRKKTAGEPC